MTTETDNAWLVGCIAVAAIYGFHQHSRASDLEGKLQVAQTEISDLQTKSASLTEASDELKQQVERFQTEDWRDVVPAAKSAADDVDTAAQTLQSSVADADNTASDD